MHLLFRGTDRPGFRHVRRSPPQQVGRNGRCHRQPGHTEHAGHGVHRSTSRRLGEADAHSPSHRCGQRFTHMFSFVIVERASCATFAVSAKKPVKTGSNSQKASADSQKANLYDRRLLRKDLLMCNICSSRSDSLKRIKVAPPAKVPAQPKKCAIKYTQLKKANKA